MSRSLNLVPALWRAPSAQLEPAVIVSTIVRVILFIGVPLAELGILAAIQDRVGWMATITLVVVTGIIGARLVARQGRQVWRALIGRVEAGEVPGEELAHGAMILVAGAFLITPGVLTDVAGFLLLVPWIRELLRVRFVRTLRVVTL